MAGDGFLDGGANGGGLVGEAAKFHEAALEARTKAAQLSGLQHEQARVLGRLESLGVCNATRALFERYVNGEWTIEEMDAAIDRYLDGK